MAEFELDFGNGGEVADINLTARGRVSVPKTDKIALIDADTIIYGACAVHEYPQEEDVGVGDMQFKEVWYLNEDDAFVHAQEKIDEILAMTGCVDFELHFTLGRENFRYKVDPQYKSNRKGKRTPAGLDNLKHRFLSTYPDKCFSWTWWEADDEVVYRKKTNPEKYVLTAVDKDVLYTLAGKHYNYYTNEKYNIEMKWIEVNEATAIRHHFKQVLTGDTNDGIIGLNMVGDKTAEKILGDSTNEQELWDKVVEAYESKGRTAVDAIKNMRLVHMHQLIDGSHIVLWGTEAVYHG